MNDHMPKACSLDTGKLEQRLASIAELGEDSLVSRAEEGGRQLLRFRASPTTHRRLEELIAAEAECCAFLDLSLSTDEDELVLSISARDEARPSAAELAAAFAKGAA